VEMQATSARPRHELVDANWQIGQAPTLWAEMGNSTRRTQPGKADRLASCSSSREWRSQPQEHDRPGNKVDHVTPANDAPNRMICMYGLPYTYYLDRHSYSALYG